VSGASDSLSIPVTRCGNEFLFPNENADPYFEFAMYDYFEENDFSKIMYADLVNLVTMDSTDSDSSCFYYWGTNLYSDKNCEELVESDGPVIENLLTNEDSEDRYIKIDVETEYDLV
jgi:hypothetical protein